MQKCRELNAEIIANGAKVTTALKLSQEDKTTIASLKQEIEKLWRMVDTAHEKESRARDTIHQLKLEIANLTKLVEQGAGITFGPDERYRLTQHINSTSYTSHHNSTQDLVKQKEELTRERDEQLDEISAVSYIHNNTVSSCIL